MHARRGFHTDLLDEALGDESPSAERWVVSYADFITLLFAFFVVMYSVSSVNDGKFRVLSESLFEVFRNPAVQSAIESARHDANASEGDAPVYLPSEDARFDPDTLDIEQVGQALQSLVAAHGGGGAAMRENGDWWQLELKSGFAFESGTDRIAAPAAALVTDIAQIARALRTPVRVEGFSDDLPSPSDDAAGTWSRSAAHAAAIAARLVQAGVSPRRVSAAAFADQLPVASNASAGGRASNRRVVIALARHGRVPAAAATLPTPHEREYLPPQTLKRVTELPGPEAIPL